jgi:hypothetical protein
MRQIPHDDILPYSGPPENGLVFLEQMESEEDSSLQAILHSAEDQYVPEERSSESKRFNQQEFTDHIRYLFLSKDKAKLLASRLKERNLLLSDARDCHNLYIF